MPGPPALGPGPCSAPEGRQQACGSPAAATHGVERAGSAAGSPGAPQAAPGGGDGGGDRSRQLASAGAAAEASLQRAASTAASVAAGGAIRPLAQQQQQAGGSGEACSPPRGGSPDPQPPAPPPKLLPRAIRSNGFYPPKLQQIRGSGRPEAVEARISSILPLLQRAGQRQRAWQAAAERGAEPAAAQVWQEFRTQQPAFDMADSQPGLEVFSVEFGAEGKRKFIATNCFWQRYSALLPQHRHHYEIIRAGRPCHLYFDLECSTAANPGLDGPAAVDGLLGLVGEALQDQFGLALQPGWVLELDSSTDAKFSRHLIIRIPGAAFASNAHAGAFVLALCARAKERRGEDARCAALVVCKAPGSGEEALLVDPAVYSRNRAFRLYLSSKAGKQSILDSTGRFGGGRQLSQRELFERCLITAVPPDARLLRCFQETEEEAAVAARRRALSGAPRGGGGGGGGGGGLPPGLGSGARLGYGPSPFPELEAFITSVCCEGGVQGRVRSWAQLGDVMLYSMRDNRWCGNVGRAHKSNGTFYVVDLRDATWHQKCYDPECRHYRSPLTPLPPHLQGLWSHQQQAALQAAGGGSQQLEGWGSIGACGSCAAATGACSCSAGWEDGWEDDDGTLLQALDMYEAEQRHPGAAQAAPAPAAAAAAAPLQPAVEEGPDDGALLEALLQYERQAAAAAAAATAATATPLDCAAAAGAPAPSSLAAGLAPAATCPVQQGQEQQRTPTAAARQPLVEVTAAAAAQRQQRKRPLEVWEKLLGL